jgi:hypothetical protein
LAKFSNGLYPNLPSGSTNKYHFMRKSSILKIPAYFALLFLGLTFTAYAQKATPVFENGEAQVVEAFKDQKNWVRHDLWVETEFDACGCNPSDAN